MFRSNPFSKSSFTHQVVRTATGNRLPRYGWRGQHTESVDNSNTSNNSKSDKDLRALIDQEKLMIDAMIRVNQAGEIGADWIYRGQMAVLGKNKEVGPVIQHMWDQEKHHLNTFNEIIVRHRVRPTFLRPIWEAAGFIIGAGTALMGKEAAMACTEAIETVIGEHYNDQLRKLIKIEQNEDIAELKEIIKKFRDDELAHLDTAVDYDAKKAPFYGPLSAIINSGSRAAIWIATRI